MSKNVTVLRSPTIDSAQRFANAYKELEPDIRDVHRMATIAFDYALSENRRHELAVFAVSQLETMTKALVEKYDDLYQRSRD